MKRRPAGLGNLRLFAPGLGGGREEEEAVPLGPL